MCCCVCDDFDLLAALNLRPDDSSLSAVQFVRRWRLGSLMYSQENALFCHNYNVRSLSAGQHDLLVSGDSSGEIAVWQV